MEDFSTTGTYIWYYFICKREVWLLAHAMEADQENDNIRLGNFIHEKSYNREKKEMAFGNNQFDIVYQKEGKLVVGEVKKSSRYLTSARMQLAFYLKKLMEAEIYATGEIRIPEEKKKEEIILDEETKDKLEQVEQEIVKIVNEEKPPIPVKNKYCKNCAYSEFCWS